MRDEAELEEEDGAVCVVCHEGYRYKPEEVRRRPAPPGARKDPGEIDARLTPSRSGDSVEQSR